MHLIDYGVFIWLAGAALFTIAIPLNYLFLKRWKEKSVIENIIFAVLFAFSNFLNFLFIWEFGENQENIYENMQFGVSFSDYLKLSKNILVDQSSHNLSGPITYYNKAMNTAFYCIILVISVILIANIFLKVKHSKKQYILSAVMCAVYFVFDIVMSVYMMTKYKIVISEVYEWIGIYTLLGIYLFAVSQYLFLDAKSNRRIYVLCFKISGLLFAAVVIFVLCFGGNWWIFCFLVCIPIITSFILCALKYFNQKTRVENII